MDVSRLEGIPGIVDEGHISGLVERSVIIRDGNKALAGGIAMSWRGGRAKIKKIIVDGDEVEEGERTSIIISKRYP